MRVTPAAILLACLLLHAPTAHAQAIGNPVFSSYDFVLQTTLEYGSSDRDLDSGRKDPEESTLDTLLLKVILGITPHIDLYFTVGQAKLDLCTGDAQEICGKDGDLNGASDIAYGGGARWTFWDSDRIKAAVGVSTLLFSVSEEIQKTDVSVDWWEYEAFVGASYPGLRWATPYAGISYSGLDGKFDGPNKVDLSADKPLGAFVGIDIPWGNYFSVTAEGRFIDQTSWSIGLNARY